MGKGLKSCGVKKINWRFFCDGNSAISNTIFMITFLLHKSIKTSNSSRHLNGDSMVPHKAVRKEIVDTDLSPPDNDFMTDVLSSTLFPEYSSFGPLWTFTCGGSERKMKIKILCHNVYDIPWNTRLCYEVVWLSLNLEVTSTKQPVRRYKLIKKLLFIHLI